MSIQNARKALDDTTFLIGPFKRSSALKELAGSEEPAAAEALASAVDANSLSGAKARVILADDRRQAWGDRLWELWSKKRQAWLAETLGQRGAVYIRADCAIGTLSRLKLGGQEIPADAATADRVAAFLRDADKQVLGAAREYLEGLKKAVPALWASALLRARLFDVIGRGRAAAGTVAPFLTGADAALAGCARDCVVQWPVADRALAFLLAGQGASLPLERETAFAVADLRADAAAAVSSGAQAYLVRALASEADFVVALAFKSGYGNKVAAGEAAVAESLRLLRDPDAEVSAASRDWLTALPRDQRYHDAIVDDWLRTDDAFLDKLLRDGQRLPSDAGREVLLRLLWGDAKGYLSLDDTDGMLLAEALAAASEARRKVVVQTVQNSRDAALAERFRRASLKVQGMDAGLALKALQASGDEDRIVDAAREMTGGELLDLCKRWAESGRRPADPRRREAVERAVALLKNLPKVEIEPAPALPAGVEDVLGVWSADKRKESELRADLQAQDPFVRAGALFALARRGGVDAATLNDKARSEDWPERLAATLCGAEADVSKDHVQWVALCAGVDEGTRGAAVACGPDEFEAAAERLAKLRAAKTPLATRAAAELDVLQLFRSLFSRGEITVDADDSADVKGAAQDGGVAAW